MIYRVYSIRDRFSDFMPPVLEQSDPIAMRNFEMAVSAQKRDTSIMAFRPSDFSLYHIADFDSDSGVLSAVVPPEIICSGDSFEVK